MKALMFLIKRSYINKMKRSFSNVFSAIITLVSVLGMGFAVVAAFIFKRPEFTSHSGAEVILAGLVLVVGLVFYNSYLSRDAGILTMADANFLFTGPFEKRTVLAYILISTAPASFLTAFFMCFYFPYLIGPALTFPKFLVVLVLVALLYGAIFLSYYYIYITNTEKEDFKNKAKYVFYVFLGILAIAFIVVFIDCGYDLKLTVKNYFTHWWYNWVPVFGWTKWAISSLLAGNWVSGFIPAAGLLVLTDAALCVALYNVKADFYEKALEDSVGLQKLIDDVKTSGSADVRSVIKLKNKAASIKYMQGAAAIYSRQRLEDKKVGIKAYFRGVFIGLLYVAIGKLFGLDFNFALAMIGMGALTMSLSDSWHRDLKKPYVYLIPASSFEKVIYSVLPGIFKTIISGCISITAGGLAYQIEPTKLISYLITFTSFAVLFIFAEVFTYRFVGASANAFVMTFIRMFFVIATCIPALIILIVIIIISQDVPDTLTVCLCMMAVNIAASALLAYLSRGIFEKSELVR